MAQTRDFGDSAGYSSGGSERDYHEVGERDQVRKPNPLDAVIKPDGKTGQSESQSESKPAGPHASDDLTDEDKTPGAGTLPSTKDGDVDAGAG